MQRVLWVALIIISGLFSLHQGNAQENTFPGRIAYIGVDSNIYTLTSSEGEPVALSTDSSSTHRYQWPTWSTDGRLAYFSTTSTGSNLLTEALISEDGASAGTLAYSSTDEVFTYAYWSPQNCFTDEKCRDLAVLLNNIEDGIFAVKLIRNSVEGDATTLTGTGSPFYFSWSPDGQRMFWQRDNSRLDIYNVAQEDVITTLSQSPGLFQAPAWSPVDDRLLYGDLGEDKQSTALAIFENNESRDIAPELSGPVAFAWSPDGRQVAYTDGQGPLVILDTATGETITRSAVRGIIAFFWSPDSQHVAYLTLASAPGASSVSALMGSKVSAIQEATGIAWSILDVESGETRRYSPFIPTREMVYMLLYFDQFAQSHRIWSPDSRYLIYSEITSNNLAVINLLDTTTVDTIPYVIADGLIGIWSFS